MQLTNMSTNSVRLFVGNLPLDVREDELRTEFSSYGVVSDVDLKTKRDPITNDILSTFAFMRMTIDSEMLEQCLFEFKQESFKGVYLNVSVAKESFLDRLQKERSNVPSGDSKIITPFTNGSVNEPVVNVNPFRDSGQKRKLVFDDNMEIKEMPVDDRLTKPNKKKIVFDDDIPLGTEVELAKESSKSSDKKTNVKANEKRLQSLKNMRANYNQHKQILKKAFQQMDNQTNNNKKIIFDDDDTEDVPSENNISQSSTRKQKTDGASSKKAKLFDASDSEGDQDDFQPNFQERPQFEGKKGEKLLKLQSRYKSDKRFELDTKFLDAEGDDSNTSDTDDKTENQEENETELELKKERDLQYKILEGVLGKTVNQKDSKKSEKNKSNTSGMLRFDPSREDHSKYIIDKSNQTKLKEKTNTKKINKPVENVEELAESVSKEKFYNISKNIANSIRNHNTGFSLLSMFGRTNETSDQNNRMEDDSPIQMNNFSPLKLPLNDTDGNFKYDSSDTEDEIESTEVKKAKQTNRKGADVFTETVFLKESESRIEDGIKFFTTKCDIAPEQNDQTELRKILKRKIQKKTSLIGNNKYKKSNHNKNRSINFKK